jgi:predicted glycosyltransferase
MQSDRTRGRAMRVLFWVQQLLGSGHLKRAATLAEAMADQGLEVTLAAGGPPMAFPIQGGIELVQLPAIRTSDPSFSQLVDAAGRPVDDALWQERQACLQRLLAERRPQVLITEMFPFGRRAFRRELLPLLEAAAAMRPRPWRLCSVRDILVKKPTTESYAWMRDLALAHYDRILVHTDPQLIPFDLTFPFAAALGDRLVDTGYVVDAAVTSATSPGSPPGAAPEVLVSAGGGRVGATLLEAAIEARPLTVLAQARWRLVAGGNLAADRFAALEARLPEGMALDRHRADFDALLANSLLSVSQAGYNTVAEGLRLGKPMVLVPFETAAETEQRIRAERLASVGLAEAVWESALAASSLARAIDAAYRRPVSAGPRLDLAALNLDGAATTARLVMTLARQPAGLSPGAAAR